MTFPALVVNTLRVLFALLCGVTAYGAPPVDDSLAAAFLVNCQHTQACMLEELTANPETDPAVLQMIQTRMAGQCEGQLAMISQYEASPRAEAMALCFRTMSEMTCAELRDHPELAACNP